MKIFNNRESLKLTLLTVLTNHFRTKFISAVRDVLSEVKKDDVTDIICMQLLKLIERSIEAINMGLAEPNIILQFSNLSENPDLMIEIETRLNNEYRDEKVTTLVVNFFTALVLNVGLMRNKDAFIECISDFSASGFKESSQKIENLRQVIGDINNALSLTVDSDNGKTFLLECDDEVGLSDSINEIRYEDSFKLLCGIDGLDTRIGGFRPNKTYMFAALSGRFKSGTLLNIALGMVSNNKLDDSLLQGKSPLLLFISFENTRAQTLERAMSYFGYTHDQIKMMNDEDMYAVLRHNLKPKTASDIRFLMKTYENASMDEEDISSVIKEYESKGYKVIAVISDYINLHKVTIDKVDEASRLIPVVKSLRNARNKIAIRHSIPFITAGQLNREGERELEAAKKKTYDAATALNASHLAGAHAAKNEVEMLIFGHRDKYNNVDCMSFNINKDRDSKGGDDDRYFVTTFEKGGFKIDKNNFKTVLDITPDGSSIAGMISAGSTFNDAADVVATNNMQDNAYKPKLDFTGVNVA
ncbi:MAG: DnaB family ATPase [Fusobacteriaceae bacterium]